MLRVTHRRRELRAEVKRVLEALGNDPWEIAWRLHRSGVRGVPNDPHDCAVARYLSAIAGTDPAVTRVVVSRTDLALRPPRRLSMPVRVVLPPAVRAFVATFDAYELPYLVASAPARPVLEHHTGGPA